MKHFLEKETYAPDTLFLKFLQTKHLSGLILFVFKMWS